MVHSKQMIYCIAYTIDKINIVTIMLIFFKYRFMEI